MSCSLILIDFVEKGVGFQSKVGSVVGSIVCLRFEIDHFETDVCQDNRDFE